MTLLLQHASRVFSPRKSGEPSLTGAGMGAVDAVAAATDCSGAGIAGVVRQWWRTRADQPRQMRVTETLALGPKRSVALLEVCGEHFLVGMGADGVSTIVQVQRRDDSGAEGQ